MHRLNAALRAFIEARLIADERMRFMLTDLASLAPIQARPEFTAMLIAFATYGFLDGAEAALDGELLQFIDEGTGH